jgi:NTP pyrophosphatase (non-canonical NTP hydrolase)
MKDLLSDQFQTKVDEVLVRHASILDILTKYDQAAATINRAVVKSITSCGCVSIETDKSEAPSEMEYSEMKTYTKTHITGELCPICKEKIEEEIGNSLFYLAALCNHLDLNLYDAFVKEYNKLNTLGKYTLY